MPAVTPQAAIAAAGAGNGLGPIAAALLGLNLAWRLVVAIRFPLYYDEAYLWELSRFPSPGYLDHPPLAATSRAIVCAPQLWGSRESLAVSVQLSAFSSDAWTCS